MEHYGLGSTSIGRIGRIDQREAIQSKLKAEAVMAQSADITPASDMQHAQDYMDQQIVQLQDRIDMLENRLLPILKPYPSDEVGENPFPADVAPLVVFVGSRSEKLRALHGRIEDLLRNLAI